jgi:hypothetical protein
MKTRDLYCPPSDGERDGGRVSWMAMDLAAMVYRESVYVHLPLERESIGGTHPEMGGSLRAGRRN